MDYQAIAIQDPRPPAAADKLQPATRRQRVSTGAGETRANCAIGDPALSQFALAYRNSESFEAACASTAASEPLTFDSFCVNPDHPAEIETDGA